MQFIVTMGIPAKNYNVKKEGFRYNGAIIQVIDWNSKEVLKEVTYSSPENHKGQGLSMQFKGGTIFKEKFYVVTNTEILVYDSRSWNLLDVYSDSTFNDLHGLLVSNDKIYVCNTGLEMVQIFDHFFNLKDEICLTRYPTWERFDRNIDYRKIATTKPHEVHANHLFIYKDKLWVTRLNKQDCVLVYDPTHSIKLSEESGCHDGIVRGEYAYFTSVSGHILKVDMDKEKVVQDVNLHVILGNRVGWTRGLEIIGKKAYVATTAIRETKFKKYLTFLSGNDPQIKVPSTIYEIDLEKEKLIDTYTLSKYPNGAIYTIRVLDP